MKFLLFTFFPVLQQKISRLVDVLKAELFRAQPLRAHGQYLLPFYFKQIGTLPHISEWLPGRNLFLESPRLLIIGSIQDHGSLVICLSSSQHHIVSALFFPYFWIPDMGSIAFRIILKGHQAFFLSKLPSILACCIDGIGFPSSIHIVVIALVLDVSGIE